MTLVGNRLSPIQLNIYNMIQGDYGAAAVLISFGALIGKVTFAQFFLLSTMEVIFYTLN